MRGLRSKEPLAGSSDFENRPRLLLRPPLDRREERLLGLGARPVEARLEGLDGYAGGGGGVADALAEDVAPDDGVAERGLEPGEHDRQAPPELPVDELLFRRGALEGERRPL